MKEIDAIAGPRGRSAFLAETATAELRRRKLLALLGNPEFGWRDEDHPEWANGSAAWVHDVRHTEDEFPLEAKPRNRPASPLRRRKQAA